MKLSPVSVGECDSMSRRSGSVRPFMMSRALAWRRANEYPSHDLANALELEPFFPEITLWLDSGAMSATQYPCSSGMFLPF